MVNVPIQQAMSSISLMTSPIIDLSSRPESPKEHQQLKATTTDTITTTTTTTTTLPPPPAQQQSTAEAMMVKHIGELEHIMANLIQVNKEIEERLDSHGSRLYTLEQLDIPQQELAQDLAEARKKKKKSRESPKTPHGSPSHQPPPPPPPAGPFRPSGAPGVFGSSQAPPPPPPPLPSSTSQESPPSMSLTPPDLEMDEDMAPNEQAQLSNDEDIGSAHIPMVNLRQGWWKPFEQERPTTPKPAWSIRSSDTGDIATFIDWLEARNNVSKPLPIGGPLGQVRIQFDFFFNKDLEYLRYGTKGRRPALSISKMKAAYYPEAGLEQMVPDQFWINEECKYDIAVMYGISHWWFQRQWFYIDRHTSEGDRSAVRTHMRILSVVRIEVFSMYGAVIFQDKYGVQMMMRFIEIHKFSDGTLQQINEALDYTVKEFRINMMTSGLNTRFWTKKDVDRCKAFMFAIQRRLRTRRIFRNLESFVGGHVREGDYKLLKRTK
nr:hypothetical protein [Tanacetum cinerariifolium]